MPRVDELVMDARGLPSRKTAITERFTSTNKKASQEVPSGWVHPEKPRSIGKRLHTNRSLWR